MPRRALSHITDAQWLAAIDDYELGHKSGSQIARELGMSPATISRRMRTCGAVKGSRVNESIHDLVLALDRKARCHALTEISDSQRRRKVAEANMQAVGRMVDALLEADRRGNISMATPVVDRVSNSIGIRQKRRSKA